VLSEDERTMASRPIEVVEAGQKITAPDTVSIGADIEVVWGQTINQDDWISIVAAGAEEGAYLDYATVYDNTRVTLTAPFEPGAYEVRYVLNENGETLASAPIEVVEVAQEVFAPTSVSAGAAIPVTWDVTVNENDWIAIVAAGAEEGAYIDYATVHDNESITLEAPSEPGLYEVRYVLYANNGTLASTQVEVVAAATKPLSD
jgi:Ca-activated chloride channel homolog